MEEITLENAGYLWWKQVSGARLYWENICGGLHSGHHVILANTAMLPWPGILREDLCNANLTQNSVAAVNIELLDDKDIVAQAAGDIASFFLTTRSMPLAIRNGFRSFGGNTLAQYLVRNNVLANQVFWVKDLKENRLNDWLSFLSECDSRSIDTGMFVLEVKELKYQIHIESNIVYLNYPEMVAPYNYFIFCVQLLSLVKDRISTQQLQYTAAVISSLCGEQLEIAAKIISDVSREPCRLQSISRIFEKTREELTNQLQGEPLNDIELNCRMWRAQVQELFPIVERYRINILDKFKERFQQAWDDHLFELINNNGQIRDDIIELELSDIYRYESRHLNFFGQQIVANTKLMKEIRNNLAHHQICSQDQVDRLFSINID